MAYYHSEDFMNSELRLSILNMICASGEGHIPSSYSIVDIINYIYEEVIDIESIQNNSIDRDYFILSKGHGAAALYAVLEKFGLLSNKEIESYGKSDSVLGGHPDMTKIRNIEASTGSLGHGLPIATGVAMGMKIKGINRKVLCLVGDGECQEGTIWEAANIASNQRLGNLIVFVDWNGSAQQLMPIENLEEKWRAFGWKVLTCDGHSNVALRETMQKVVHTFGPTVILARTIKGKGSKLIEGHGIWHHKIPNPHELAQIQLELKGA
jgi:transketolase